MADPFCVRDLLRSLQHSWRWAGKMLSRVSTACPLCDDHAMGGELCGPCRADVTASKRLSTTRCELCLVNLGRLTDLQAPAISRTVQPVACPDCKGLRPVFDRVITAFDYISPGDVLIHQFKTAGRLSHVRLLGQLLVDAAQSATPTWPDHTIVVPVPSSQEAIIRRGFNPAAELARYVGSRLNLPVRVDLLQRQREGTTQKHLGRLERTEAARRLYKCLRPIPNTCVAVVDDVMTTGATLQSIATELKDNGARMVTGLVLARTPYHSARPYR